MGFLPRGQPAGAAFAPSRTRVLGPLALALAAHAGILVAGSRLPPVEELFGSRPAEQADRGIDLDLETPAAVAPPEPTLPSPEVAALSQRDAPAVTQPAAVAPLGSRSDRIATAQPSRTSVAGSAGEAPGAQPPNGSGEPGLTPGGRNPAPNFDEPEAGPGFDGGTSAVLTYAFQGSHAAPTTAPEAAPIDRNVANRALASTLRSHDKKTGVNVPGAGVVASAVSTTVRGMPLPHNAHAVIEVSVGADGKLNGARVVSASAGDAAEWAAATKAMENALASQVLAVGADVGPKGVIVRVNVTQKHVFPTGTANGMDLKPVCANGFINELASAADDKPQKEVESKIPIFEDEFGRPCIPVGVSAVADASNIGANKHIRSRARSRSSSRVKPTCRRRSIL